AYSIRPKPDARVSAPLTWEELESCRPEDFTLHTMPPRFARLGDRHADIDAHPCSLDPLLELSRAQEASGLGDAPWPPHYRKQEGEPRRGPAPPAREGGRTAAGGGRRRTKRRTAESSAGGERDGVAEA